ncbi:MAG TPA: type II secretion system F family protein [Candidatus Limnocylindrales bacterium]|nr:type II secretion system F family protein [Candidatus Limnocylindrales bacterium]
MSEYVCKVVDTTGRVFQQLETAQTEAEARQKLADRGLYVYTVRPNLSLTRAFSGPGGNRKLPAGDFLIFNQQFNTLIKAGLPILKALDLLADRAALPKIRPLLNDVRLRVREGEPLSDAFEAAGVFPTVYVTALRAGEKSGDLPGILDDYIAYQRVMTGIRKKLIGVVIYPIILIVVASCIVSYLVAYVIPQFAKLYSDLGTALPTATQFLITVVVGYRAWLIAFAAIIIFGTLFLYLWSKTSRGGMVLDRAKLKVPVIGDVWIKFQMAQFTRTLATLLRGGTPLVAALDTAANAMTSRLISTSIHQAAARVREGASLHSSLAETRMIPDLALDMIEVGEASGALAPMLGSVAQFYDEETNLKTGALISIIEPAVLIMIASLIFFIMVALYLPLFSLRVGSAG